MEVDVRVIAATNRNLVDQVNENQFREDLFYRLAAITLRLPPLRDRGDDIIRIAEVLLEQINQQFLTSDPSYTTKTLSPSAKEFISQQRWPGNVRQVYNSLLQAAVFNAENEISDADLSSALSEIPGRSDASILDHTVEEGFELKEVLDEVSRHYIQIALQRTSGNATQAAKLLGSFTAQTLRNRMKDFGIS